MNLWIVEHGEYAYAPLRQDAQGYDALQSSMHDPLDLHALAVARNLRTHLRDKELQMDAITTSLHMPANYTAQVVAEVLWSTDDGKNRLDVVQTNQTNESLSSPKRAREFFAGLGANVLAVYCPGTLADFYENLGIKRSELPIRFGSFIGPILL